MEFLVVQIACILILGAYLGLFCVDRANWMLAIFIYSASTTLTGSYLLADTFTGEGVTESVIFHLFYGLEGVKLSEFTSYILAAALFSLMLAFSINLFWRMNRRHKGQQKRQYRLAEFVALGAVGAFAVALHPTTLQSAQIISDMLVKPGTPLNEELAKFEIKQTNKLRKKSLVYIYAESFERIFLEEKIFPGLAPNLTILERGSLHIRGIRQAPLTDWTIAGMVASQCGVPLATFRIDRNEFSGVNGFMPGATCLGDVLNQAGYHSVFMGGADLNFAGKGRFYKEHGFQEVIGKDDLEAVSHQVLPLSKWGVYDDALLENAFDKFKVLADAEQPFALFLLTLDTHPPIGHVTPSCEGQVYSNGESGLLNAVHCSDRLLSEFIKKIERHGADDLVLVVASDHLQMRNDINNYMVAHSAQRENLFFVRGKGIDPRLIERPATTLDIFPTLLHLLGWDVEGVALGRNMLSSSKTLTEKYGTEQFYSSLQKWRMDLWKMWSPPSTD